MGCCPVTIKAGQTFSGSYSAGAGSGGDNAVRGLGFGDPLIGDYGDDLLEGAAPLAA